MDQHFVNCLEKVFGVKLNCVDWDLTNEQRDVIRDWQNKKINDLERQGFLTHEHFGERDSKGGLIILDDFKKFIYPEVYYKYNKS
jgi:hypothetical protein